MSVFGVPVTGIFLFSIFFPSATQLSVMLGGVVSGCLMFWINMGSAFNVKYHPALQFAPTDQCVNITLVNVTAPVINDVINRSAEDGGFGQSLLVQFWGQNMSLST
ncbi:hypothetical protein KP79_PYT12864 [Mizuhopecten yessoensis]|uniref:Sodium-coupled monocarboxylate transporter 1 n=1 Tax=Mizuhopecten yessoensis TaxID=6573 RepID=A0A210QVT9_MIZYE|nr:hypothetical protein KP79_PYT12864 [Mizuhopecten yessoensis]